LPIGVLRGQVEIAEVWLANSRYQHSDAAAVQWLVAGPTGAWLATATANNVRYMTQRTQDARVWELSALREWRLDAARSVHLGVTAQRDEALSTRPGGDRSGYQLQAGAVLLYRGWRLHPQLAYSSWDSEDVFAPGLIDVRRRNRMRQADLQAERPLGENTSLLLEWRGKWVRDTVALYRFQQQLLSATLSIRF
jgi:hypothetical protein